jgi:hypothetical protein
MGLFDLPAPLFTVLDSLMNGFPALPRLLVWATITGIISMLLYWLCSAQDKVEAAKTRAIDARRKMAAYEGAEFGEMWPRAQESLVSSLKHFTIVLVPAVVSSLPALSLIVWVSGTFGYDLPEAGETINASTVPVMALQGLTAAPNADNANNDAYELTYPQVGQTAEVTASNGELLTTLPLTTAIPVVHKKQWWNSLIANPNGYLADSYEVEAIYFDLAPQEFLSFGPGWIRGWEFSYFVLLILVSLAVKFAFKIH